MSCCGAADAESRQTHSQRDGFDIHALIMPCRSPARFSKITFLYLYTQKEKCQIVFGKAC